MSPQPMRQPSLADTFQTLPRWWWLYVVLVGCLALFGAGHSAAPVLLATLITLPIGIGAIVFTYLGYGMIVLILNGFGVDVTSGPGFGPLWFVIVFKAYVTTLFVVAAIGNSTLIQRSLNRLTHRA